MPRTSRPSDVRMTSMRPVVGITAYEEDARWGPWSEPAVLVPSTYVHAVERARAARRWCCRSTQQASQTCWHASTRSFCRAAPTSIRAATTQSHTRTPRPPRPERDEFELALVEAASGSDTPTLAICRGLQVLNVARGWHAPPTPPRRRRTLWTLAEGR